MPTTGPTDPDPFEDPEWVEWATRVSNDVVPMILKSAISLSLVPKGKADIKFAVELGLCIMMDKPIIAVVQPGTKVPAKLIAVCDEIIEASLDEEDFTERMAAAIKRVKP